MAQLTQETQAPPGPLLGWGASIFSPDHQGWVAVPEEVLGRHMYILGTTGSGKTTLLRNLVFQLTRMGYGVLCIDLKGEAELWRDLWRGCVRAGREEAFTYLSPITSPPFPEATCTINPLLRGAPDVVAARLQAAFASPTPKDEFWEQNRLDNLRTLCMAFDSAGRTYTFSDLARALLSPKHLMTLAQLIPPGPAREQVEVFYSAWQNNQRVYAAYTKGTRVSLQALALGLPAQLVDTAAPTLDLFDAIRSSRVIYAYLPVLLAPDPMRTIGKLILAELLYSCGLLASTGRTVKFAVIIDEFQMMLFKGVTSLLAQSRSAGLTTVVAHQTLADIEVEQSASFARSLLDNTATKVVLPVKSRETAEALADIIGTYPPLPLLGKWIQLRHLIHPDVLTGKNELYEHGLGVGEAIVKMDGLIYRVKVPSPSQRTAQVVGCDLPAPALSPRPIPVRPPFQWPSGLD